MFRQHSDNALAMLLRFSMSRGLSDIALKNAIEIIYVEAAFRYCTYSTLEIIHVKTTFSYCTCNAIKIIYVQTAFSCCTFSPMEIINDKSNACSFEEGHVLDKAPHVF